MTNLHRDLREEVAVSNLVVRLAGSRPCTSTAPNMTNGLWPENHGLGMSVKYVDAHAIALTMLHNNVVPLFRQARITLHTHDHELPPSSVAVHASPVSQLRMP